MDILWRQCVHTTRSCQALHHIPQNEAQIGEAIREEGVPREEIFITSKVAPFQQGTEKSRKSVANSLANLQVPNFKMKTF